MNAATRTAVRYALCHGHTPVAIYNGFVGLLEGNVAELSWLRVDQWTTRGGSELGTNRTLPDSDMEGIAAKLQEYKIDSLLIIGGFEAMVAVNQLEKARDSYKALKIPLVHLPATISNNVPITEWSIGSDTSINVLVEACDAIKQSASASRNRVFVVETQGAGCGYIAMLGALAVSAPQLLTRMRLDAELPQLALRRLARTWCTLPRTESRSSSSLQTSSSSRSDTVRTSLENQRVVSSSGENALRLLTTILTLS